MTYPTLTRGSLDLNAILGLVKPMASCLLVDKTLYRVSINCGVTGTSKVFYLNLYEANSYQVAKIVARKLVYKNRFSWTTYLEARNPEDLNARFQSGYQDTEWIFRDYTSSNDACIVSKITIRKIQVSSLEQVL